MPKTSDLVLSGSSDKYLKLWIIDDEISAVSSVRLNESIEKFVLVEIEGQLLILVANGNLLSLVSIDEKH